ncbi:MAG: hypothetical protein COU25_02390 [Candidatus Levybacteria bacterium CG10_big_fil_rev_8_21_14_0_10_35_13]|nr:MAG: hypothetical protein COU25_02390 [Candidatus Levybacteria bacterium CG10_big_fil_rev_8_21_14_0_10_35_13]
MAKRFSTSEYKSFKLHGNHPVQTVVMYVLFDLFMAAVLGFFLQPTIASAITSYAAGVSY